ncbi:MAG: DUF1697 domain-containing protein [Bdellovibrionales bacterium]|nr:DUF1697 domain-containing protein [Bdellovibrionales bacterium]
MSKLVTYVALLRGINVGGNNIIKMNDLKKCFEALNFSNVKTYIASGNVIFSANKIKNDVLIKTIEEALRKTFGYKAIIVLRTQAEIEATVDGFPKIFKNITWKHNVIFLGKDIDSKSILKSLSLKDDIETITYKKGVIYWSAQMKNITKSNMLKLSSKPEYQRMTVRNQNTTRKILALMKKD